MKEEKRPIPNVGYKFTQKGLNLTIENKPMSKLVCMMNTETLEVIRIRKDTALKLENKGWKYISKGEYKASYKKPTSIVKKKTVKFDILDSGLLFKKGNKFSEAENNKKISLKIQLIKETKESGSRPTFTFNDTWVYKTNVKKKDIVTAPFIKPAKENTEKRNAKLINLGLKEKRRESRLNLQQHSRVYRLTPKEKERRAKRNIRRNQRKEHDKLKELQ